MDIVHDERAQKFFVDMAGKQCALNYKELSNKLWNFVSTTIPENIPPGIMEKMVEFAINFVKRNNIKILVNCSDVQDFLVKHKDLKDLVYHPY